MAMLLAGMRTQHFTIPVRCCAMHSALSSIGCFEAGIRPTRNTWATTPSPSHNARYAAVQKNSNWKIDSSDSASVRKWGTDLPQIIAVRADALGGTAN